MKRNIAFMIVSILILSLAGCSNAGKEAAVEERISAVKVLKIEESQKPVKFQYLGTVDAKDITKYSFKTGGKISRIYVKKGDKIGPAAPLAEIDTQDLGFQMTAAKAAMDAAELNIKKAEDALRYNKDLFEKVDSLYTAGAVSKDQYDQTKLQMDISETTYQQAGAQFDATKTDYEYKTAMIQDAKLYAQQEGTVVDVLFEENERIGANTPVVVVRSSEQVVNVGIPQQDLYSVHTGAGATVDIDGEKAEGRVIYIAEAPDEATRTYHAEIEVPGKSFKLGAIAKAEVFIGAEKGVWIPMTSIFSNGEDYVYIVKDARVFKRTVELLNVSDDKIRVNGIDEGELLAVSGMKNLNDGAKVNIVE
ncbi:efflux RND transporter periplasmic adaptor subunit [Geosporobacter ferrireducens]|uniref:Uncharacterized protein n=1 Tax=Geosporobacter ferrireducens TaxID=1424294 RepID=A0A1D8GGT4_9FIRM|nr:efflux RND transporter periplasmic adaptor subunit [Geosporobacter ferrireducens]AOT70118.1 hypothetical protein Gferi_11260 [Geosporobacter ferrireducens]